jgi:hypothetical protein
MPYKSYANHLTARLNSFSFYPLIVRFKQNPTADDSRAGGDVQDLHERDAQRAPDHARPQGRQVLHLRPRVRHGREAGGAVRAVGAAAGRGHPRRLQCDRAGVRPDGLGQDLHDGHLVR